MLSAMKLLFQHEDELILKYKDFYFLQPIQLCMKLKQVTQMVEKEAEF